MSKIEEVRKAIKGAYDEVFSFHAFYLSTHASKKGGCFSWLIWQVWAQVLLDFPAH